MNKITVVQAVENLRIGGIEKMVSTVAQGLNKDKYDVKVYCLAEGGAIADELIRNGCDVRVLNLRTYHNPVNILKLAGLMRKDRVDILHTHGYFASTFARLAAVIARVPIIFTKISSTYYDLKFKHRLTERVLSLFSDKIICVSDAVREFVVRTERIDPGKITVIRNGGRIKPPSHPEVTLRSGWGIKEGDKVIGTVARLEPVKGVEHLIRAAATVVNAVDDVKFLIVGDGVQRRELESLADTLQIKDKVVFTGFLMDPQDALSIMDIFVLASAEREGFSSALTEAMGFGLPVIATKIGGNVEAVSDGINGVLIPPKDPGAMAKAIIALLKDPPRAKKMAEESEKLYREKFSAGIMINKIEELYDLYVAKKLKVKTEYKIIFFPEGNTANPASRYNCYYLAEALTREGIRTCISHSVFPYGKPLNYAREKYLLIKNLLKKSLVILTSNKGDIIFIQRGIPWRGFFDRAVFRLYLFAKRTLKRRIIFHFDDAIYLNPPEYPARTIIEISDMVIAGSHHLRDYALKLNKNVFLIPTSIDTDKWKPGQDSGKDKNGFRIGWCGTGSNLKYLSLLRKPLSILGKKFDIELKIIGPESEAGNLPGFENVKITYQPWDLDDEMRAISKFDIGIMPLYDGEAERGKCGLKLLLYMSLGIPAIGSAVGENRHIIRDGENGFLASDEKEWVEKLEALITDDNLRERFSFEGRRTVIERYSLKGNAGKLAQIIKDLSTK
ncbi:MAG: glycosyltransferase [Candidatus Omnitrophica bacterium]|nr:glycosyltransferase [Candidatus Omnitrophota bacterium]